MAVQREGRWMNRYEVDIVEVFVDVREDSWKV